MALPIQHQQVLVHGGTSEQASDLALPDLFSPRNSQNVRVSKLGEVKSVNGHAELNAASQIVSTNGQNMAVTGIWFYENGATRRLVAVGDDGTDEVEVWHSTNDGVTWSRLKTLGATAVGRTPDADQLDDKLYIVFGAGVAVQSYNGTACTDAGQTRPAAVSVAVVAGATGNLSGQYQYRQALVDSSGIVGPASPVSSSITVSGGRATVGNLDSSGAGGLRVFRTTGDGGVFFATADFENGSVPASFDDNLSDRDLRDRQAEMVNSGDAPPKVSFAEQHRSRMFYLDDDTIYPSDPNLGQSVPAFNSFKVGQGQDSGDVTTGFSGDFRGEGIVWREHSVWRLVGDGRESWNTIRTGASVGTPTHRSAVRIEAGASYVNEKGDAEITDRTAYFYVGTDNTLRLFLGDADVSIGAPLQDTLDRINYAARGAIRAVDYPPYGWVLIGLPLDANTKISHWVAWDYKRGFCHSNAVTFFPQLRDVALASTASVGHYLVGGGDAASVFRLFVDNDAGGANITIRIWEKPSSLGVPHRLKVARSCEPWFLPQAASTTVTMKLYEGFADIGATEFESYTFELQESDVDVASPGQKELTHDTTGRYAVSTAFTISWEIASQKDITFLGRILGFQVLPPSESRPS